MKIGVLVSGKLGFDTLLKIANSRSIEIVYTDGRSTDIINWCINNDIRCFSGNPRQGKGYDSCKDLNIDVFISVNYLFIIEEDLINHAKIIAFNIHGSLLPKYRGRTPHVWAIINNEKYTGVTAHEIDVGCDTGRIISQVKIIIESDDTGGTLLSKFEKVYFDLISKVLTQIEENTIELVEQNNEDATFFGKRTPEDGLINWNWNKVRIKNWVRAQSYPYPGAFTFYNKAKIIIDWVEEVDFSGEGIPGQIIRINPTIVKCLDGALLISKQRTNIDLSLGMILE